MWTVYFQNYSKETKLGNHWKVFGILTSEKHLILKKLVGFINIGCYN